MLLIVKVRAEITKLFFTHLMTLQMLITNGNKIGVRSNSHATRTKVAKLLTYHLIVFRYGDTFLGTKSLTRQFDHFVGPKF